MLTGPTYYRGKENRLVLGTAGLGGAWGDVDYDESLDTIVQAVQDGVTRIDTAPAYFRAEELVGKALRRIRGFKPFVSTKVGKAQGRATDSGLNDYRLSAMKESVERSMELLGRRSLDLLFLHEPENVPIEQLEETVDFLAELKKNGKTVELGFGGAPTEGFGPYIQKGIFDVVMGYNNLNACNLSGLSEKIPYYRRNTLQVYQGSLLHMGLLGNRLKKYRAHPPEWVSESDLDNALYVDRLAEYLGWELSTLAHKFAHAISEIDWLVIGPKNKEQFENTMRDFSTGSLAENTFNKIVNNSAPHGKTSF